MTKEQAIEILNTYYRGEDNDDREFCSAIDMVIKALEQQPSDDCVSRAAVGHLCFEYLKPNIDDNIAFYEHFCDLPPVTPTRKVGKWIYDKASQNWRCSVCNKTPKTLGFVGTADFMEKEFVFCNHCGAEMVGAEND